MSIVFVSNRLPVVIEQSESGWSVHRGSGGLVTALDPLLRRAGGTWLGWPGAPGLEPEKIENLLSDFSRSQGYRIAAVPLAEEEYIQFYEGFCNQIIWPLFHDLQSLCNFQPEFWQYALQVEQKFALAVESHTEPEDLIWVHDYQLMGLGKILADRGLQNKLAFFLHIPFPPPDIFCKLPWRRQVLKALLCYDVIGLQTTRDLDNFTQCVRRLLPDVQGRHTPRQANMKLDGHSAMIGVFPIGIDYEEFADGAAQPEIVRQAAELRKNFPGRQIILGVDRLDYTKGVLYRLRAMARALERYPDLRQQVTFFQVVVPSRENVPQYQTLKTDIEQSVAQINGKYTEPGWIPIHHVFRHVGRKELLAWYRVADVAMVTSLKDGMNLVAKEYCACQIDGNGVLVLSEFAGAAEQLGRWAVLINPYDTDGVAEAIKLAVMMTPSERRPAMEKLRLNIREQNVYWWLSEFLMACGRDHEHPDTPLVAGDVI